MAAASALNADALIVADIAAGDWVLTRVKPDAETLAGIWKALLHLDSGCKSEEHQRAVLEGRATLYQIGSRGFILVAKHKHDLVVLANGGRRLFMAGLVPLATELARAEGCTRIVASTEDERVARRFHGLGFDMKPWGGSWLLELRVNDVR